MRPDGIASPKFPIEFCHPYVAGLHFAHARIAASWKIKLSIDIDGEGRSSSIGKSQQQHTDGRQETCAHQKTADHRH